MFSDYCLHVGKSWVVGNGEGKFLFGALISVPVGKLFSWGRLGSFDGFGDFCFSVSSTSKV